MLRVYKFRLNPTRLQAADMDALVENLRLFYNACLQERRDAYAHNVAHRLATDDPKASVVTVNRGTQEKAITVIKHDAMCPEYKGIHTHLLQNVVKRLDLAFDGFFRRVKAGQTPGYPRFKSFGRYNTFTFKDAGKGNGAEVLAGGKRLRLSGIGNVKMKQHRPMEGVLKTIGVTKDTDGHWYALITREVEPRVLAPTGEGCGLDVGLTTFAALSDGTLIANPRPLKTARLAVARAARKVSRRKRGSKRQQKARRLLAKKHCHVRNVRKDFHHKTARAIVQKYDHIAIEDLNIKGLARGMLAKAVNDAGWGQFDVILTGKAEEAGRVLARVDPRDSSQTCSGCWAIVPKDLSVRIHDCPHCRLVLDRDVNAARVIYYRAFAVAYCAGLGQGLRGEAA